MRRISVVVLGAAFLTACGVVGVQIPGGIRIIGSEEIVFDWSTNRCEDIDIPDIAARAFRDAGGMVQLISSHYRNRRMIGSTLDTVQRQCQIIMDSHRQADPAKYDDQEWIAATYTEDGATIYALVHNEYQGNTHPGQCPSGLLEKCWYNSITLVMSADAGQTYFHAAAPGHLVASIPYPYVADWGISGVFNPTNIIRSPRNGFYYEMPRVLKRDLQQEGRCVMRTGTLANPTSWRAWNGSGYVAQFISPYLNPGADPAQHVCKPVSFNEIGHMEDGSLVYSTHLNKFVIVGTGFKNGVYGFYYSVSNDLVNWQPMALVMKTRPAYVPGPGDAMAYPSFLDPSDASRNFERIGKQPYLYFVRLHGGLDRDLVRVRVEFQ